MSEDSDSPDASTTRQRPSPKFGFLALVCSVGAIVCFFIGMWVIDANTPPPPPPPPPVSLNDVADELKRELAEESSKLLDSATRSLKERWFSRQNNQTEDAENSRQPDEEASPETAAAQANPAEGPVHFQIESNEGGFRFGLSLGSRSLAPPRPAWIDMLEKSLLYIILGGSALGVVLGLASQVRGEYPAWGLAAEAIGSCTISLTLLAIWVAMIIAAAAAVAILVVLSALTGVSIDFSI